MQPHTRYLASALFLSVWVAAISGTFLASAPAILLAAHIISSVGVLAPLVWFLYHHWWERRRRLTGRRTAWAGSLAAATLFFLLLSGLLLVPWTNVGWLRRLHGAAAALLVIALTVHTAWRLPRLWRIPRQWTQVPAWRWLATGGAVLAVTTVAGWTLPQIEKAADSPAAAPLAHATLPNVDVPGQADCASCHQNITDQWRTSAHAHAATDPYYLALTGLFMQERGVEAVQYCAACHNPLGLMRGEVTENAVVAKADDPEAQTDDERRAAYRARALTADLHMSSLAAEGVTCVICHLGEAAEGSPRNGALELRIGDRALPQSAYAELAVRAAPKEHVAAFARDAMDDAALCGACHNLRSPDGVLLEPTYDEWLASPYAKEGVTCQDCHLPEQRGRLVDTGSTQPVAAHGGVPGAPSSLPGVTDNTTLLRQAATLSATLAHTPAGLQAEIVVTNSGAGHYLPTGADDLRQVWLEVMAYDEAGNPVWQSGAVDEQGRLDAGAVRFGKILGDAQGKPVSLHRFWIATQVLADTRLAPLEARTVSFDIDLPQGTPPVVRLAARLLYRDVSKEFAEFALDRPVTALPIFEMAKADAQPPVYTRLDKEEPLAWGAGVR